jgi:hypothetical protein
MPRYLPLASDETLVELAEIVQEGLLQNPGSCQAAIAQGGNWLAVGKSGSAELEHITELMGQMITTGATQPRLVEREREQVARSIGTVLPGLDAKHGEDLRILNSREAMAADPATACRVLPDFFQSILQLPPSQSGPVFRVMLSPS